tara:strand:- start:211 stop:498 length:288 start_codon:yes stop_codon:yes gene_type:complete
MSLGERDEIIQKLNAAFNVVCDEVDTVKRKLKESGNPYIKEKLDETENISDAINDLKSYLEESLDSTDNKQVKKKIKLAIKQLDSSIKKKSSDSV